MAVVSSLDLIARFNGESNVTVQLTAKKAGFLETLFDHFSPANAQLPENRAERITEARGLIQEIIRNKETLLTIEDTLFFSSYNAATPLAEQTHRADTRAASKVLRFLEYQYPEILEVTQQLKREYPELEKNRYYTQAEPPVMANESQIPLPYTQMSYSSDGSISYTWYIFPNENNRKLFVDINTNGNFLPAKTTAELDSLFTAHIGSDKSCYVRNVSDYFVLRNHNNGQEITDKLAREALGFIQQSLLNPYSFCRTERWSTSAHKYTRSFLELLSFFRAEYADRPEIVNVIDPVVKQIAAHGKGGILTQSVLAQFSGTTYLPARNLNVTAINEGTAVAKVTIAQRS